MIKTLLLATSLYAADSAPIHYNSTQIYQELKCNVCDKHDLKPSMFTHNVTENVIFDDFLSGFVKNYHDKVVVPLAHAFKNGNTQNMNHYKKYLVSDLERKTTEYDLWDAKVIDQVNIRIGNDGLLDYYSLNEKK